MQRSSGRCYRPTTLMLCNLERVAGYICSPPSPKWLLRVNAPSYEAIRLRLNGYAGKGWVISLRTGDTPHPPSGKEWAKGAVGIFTSHV